MNLITLIILAALFMALMMAVAWYVVIKAGKAGYADVFWSLGIGLSGAGLVLLGPQSGPAERRWLVIVVILVWAIRLAVHIGERTIKGGDDPRYVQLRKEWGDDAYPKKLFGFLEIQALVGFLMALSALAAATNPAPFGLFDILAVLVAIAAIVGETIADRQLAAFRADPANKGKVCDVGLWSVSRHPNYFFEWLAWMPYPLFGITFIASHPWGWASLIAPALIYWLLVYASGIPPTEAHMLRSRGDAFRDYQRRVNAFWPIPKSKASS